MGWLMVPGHVAHAAWLPGRVLLTAGLPCGLHDVHMGVERALNASRGAQGTCKWTRPRWTRAPWAPWPRARRMAGWLPLAPFSSPLTRATTARLVRTERSKCAAVMACKPGCGSGQLHHRAACSGPASFRVSTGSSRHALVWCDFLSPSPHSKVRLDRLRVLYRAEPADCGQQPHADTGSPRGALSVRRASCGLSAHCHSPVIARSASLPAILDSSARAPHMQTRQ